MTRISLRRRFLGGLLLLSAVACQARGEQAREAKAETHVRIGYQKSSPLVLLKWRGTLEASLQQHHVSVEWAEFPAGPVLIEALNAGQLDIGYVGEAPPIFGQAASSSLVYVAVDRPSPKNEAILVPRDSSIHTLADLKGKTVALNKGSNVHYFLVRALAKAGLGYRDVQVAFLPPADARAAFENGTIDAWVIWDPYLAAAEVALGPRVLSTGEGIVDNNSFYIARREFIDAEAELSRSIFEQVRLTDEWARQHRDEVAKHLGPLLGIDDHAIQASVARSSWGIGPIGDETISAQQRIADTFLELGLLEKPLRVRDALPLENVLR